jgi:hypothetical protein
VSEGEVNALAEQMRISALRNDDLSPCHFLNAWKSSDANLQEEREHWCGLVG